jgi:lipopolysaccharide transport system ATP-binding protein
MVDDVVIRAEGVGKKYLIGHAAERERYVALRDVLARQASNLWRKTAGMARGRAIVSGDTVEEFWALKDVSFEVKRGEVLGIIGHNGAGKSTLLKIVSRITEPSEGRVTIRGRVASLLEVGTGFHPELTGRENIYLNGAILGMSRGEIRKKFDEIVAFAGVEKFLDTPVKRYSSGMYVRLAFAVAAHLEPEILVVDEVLAVGDAEFQKKCLGKMDEVSRREGRTVLFVSHNMSAIEALCPRSIGLAAGVIVFDGNTNRAIDHYLKMRRSEESATQSRSTQVHEGLVIEHVDVSPPVSPADSPRKFVVGFHAERPGQFHECALLIYTIRGLRVAIVDLREFGTVPLRYRSGSFTLVVEIAEFPLVESDFTVGIYLVTDRFSGNILELTNFAVSRPRSDLGYVPYPAEVQGIVALDVVTTSLLERRPAMAS